jgi:glutamate--cysteine ligase
MMPAAACDTAELSAVLRDREQAEGYVASICFKHGPPRLLGVELEWTVHHADDPSRPLDPHLLACALGSHAPETICPDSPHDPLPSGTSVTLEPGGQVEISSPPSASLAQLYAGVSTDFQALSELLSAHGLLLGTEGLDKYRPPQRVLHTSRYRAMEKAFAPIGNCGIRMMCSSAGVQVCLDAGEGEALARRWRALHALGPIFCALFANSATPTGWCSGRQRVALRTDPCRSLPCSVGADPPAAWARRVLEASVIRARESAGSPKPESRLSFADWIAGASARRPTLEDLRYHLSTMFPPVRPRGYFEVRYIDTQPGAEWLGPVALLVALMSTAQSVDAVLDRAAPAEGRWLHAARYGLADRRVAAAAKSVVALGVPLIERTDLAPSARRLAVEQVQRRIHHAQSLPEASGGAGRSAVGHT